MENADLVPIAAADPDFGYIASAGCSYGGDNPRPWIYSLVFANETEVPSEVAFINTNGHNPRYEFKYSKNLAYGY